MNENQNVIAAIKEFLESHDYLRKLNTTFTQKDIDRYDAALAKF